MEKLGRVEIGEGVKIREDEEIRGRWRNRGGWR